MPAPRDLVPQRPQSVGVCWIGGASQTPREHGLLGVKSEAPGSWDLRAEDAVCRGDVQGMRGEPRLHHLLCVALVDPTTSLLQQLTACLPSTALALQGSCHQGLLQNRPWVRSSAVKPI